MTAPRHQQSAAECPQWCCERLNTSFICRSSVLETVRSQAVEALNCLSHGGLETGGILLGRRTKTSIEIVSAQAIECEHQRGPSFALSTADEAALQAALDDRKTEILEPIGLYISHSRRGFKLTEDDIRILDRYFPQAWQVALVVVPHKTEAMRAGFFLRGSVSEPTFSCSHEISLPPPEPDNKSTEEQCADTSRAPARTVVTRAMERAGPDEEQVPALEPPAASPAGVELETRTEPKLTSSKKDLPALVPPERVPAAGSTWRNSQLGLAATLVLLFAGAATASALWLRARQAPEPLLPIHISDLGSHLRIEWDPADEPIRGTTAARLEIRDGGTQAVSVPMNREGLDRGGFLYTPRSGMVEVHLRLLGGKANPPETLAYFVNPVSVDPEPPAKSQPAELVPTAAPPEHTANAIPAKPLNTAAKPPLIADDVPSEIPRRRIIPSDESASKAAGRVEHRALERRQFRPPQRKISLAKEVRAPAALPDLPAVHVGQQSSTAPLANALMAAAHEPITLPPPSRSQSPSQPRAGRLIWTGDLRKNASLVLTGAGASQGVLNGTLPGVPVKVNVYPAELVDRGITIYSHDQRRSGTSELPSARNGWNAVVYKWDPKRAADVSVVEQPSSTNNWRQVVLRNGNRNLSVLVVDWQRVGSQ